MRAACFGGCRFGKRWSGIRAGGSFVAEGDDGIEASGAAGGQPGCDGCDDDEKDGHGDEGGGVGGFNADEHGSHFAGDGVSGKKTGSDADDGEAKSLTDDELEDVGGLSAEGHANADFGGALADDGGEDAVKPDAGEERGDDRERSDEEQGEARAGLGFVNQGIHGLEVGDQEMRIESFEGGANVVGVVGGIAIGAEGPAVGVAGTEVGVGKINLLAAGVG